MNLRFEQALPNEFFLNFRGLTISLQQNDFFISTHKMGRIIGWTSSL